MGSKEKRKASVGLLDLGSNYAVSVGLEYVVQFHFGLELAFDTDRRYNYTIVLSNVKKRERKRERERDVSWRGRRERIHYYQYVAYN